MVSLIKQKLREDGVCKVISSLSMNGLINIEIIKTKNKDNYYYEYIVIYNNNCILNTKEYNNVEFRKIRRFYSSYKDIVEATYSNKDLKTLYKLIMKQIEATLTSIKNKILNLRETLEANYVISNVINFTILYKLENKVNLLTFCLGDYLNIDENEYTSKLLDIIKDLVVIKEVV